MITFEEYLRTEYTPSHDFVAGALRSKAWPSHAHDIVANCGEYHAWGVKYCWMIDPDNKRCWQYDSGGRLNEVPVDGSIEAGPIILSHADIFQSA